MIWPFLHSLLIYISSQTQLCVFIPRRKISIFSLSSIHKISVLSFPFLNESFFCYFQNPQFFVFYNFFLFFNIFWLRLRLPLNSLSYIPEWYYFLLCLSLSHFSFRKFLLFHIIRFLFNIHFNVELLVTIYYHPFIFFAFILLNDYWAIFFNLIFRWSS